jgi:uncharacterized ferritin-like protein (DUF455 family)
MIATDTVEDWAHRFIRTQSLAEKIAPGAPPTGFSDRRDREPPAEPGRPPELRVTTASPRTPGPDALRDPKQRARLLHTFWHHELQAAELMCWALLRYPDAEPAFRSGLAGIAVDEIRHMGL